MIIRQFNFFHIFTKEETFDRNIIGLMYCVSFNFSNKNDFPHERKSNLCRYQTDSGFLVATTNQQLNSLTSVTAPVSHSVYLCPRKALKQILLFATLATFPVLFTSAFNIWLIGREFPVTWLDTFFPINLRMMLPNSFIAVSIRSVNVLCYVAQLRRIQRRKIFRQFQHLE